MSCRIDYIDRESILSKEDKSRLSDIHLAAYNELQKSSNFRLWNDKLYSKKYLYHLAISDVAKVNQSIGQGKTIARLVKNNTGQTVVSINVLELASPFKKDLAYYNNDAALMEQENKDIGDTVSEDEVIDIWKSKVENRLPKEEFMKKAKEVISLLSYMKSKPEILDILHCI